MPTIVQCSGCGTKLKAPENSAGKKIRCPKCRADVPVVVKLDLRLAGKAQDAIRGALASVVDGGTRIEARDRAADSASTQGLRM